MSKSLAACAINKHEKVGEKFSDKLFLMSFIFSFELSKV